VKRAFAIVSVLLVIGNLCASVAGGKAVGESIACRCCHCGQPACCAAPASPESQPAPQVPPDAKSKMDLRAGLAPQLLYVRLRSSDRTFPPCSSTIAPAALPLYEQTCSFLI
jgi:hypothetical protein